MGCASENLPKDCFEAASDRVEHGTCSVKGTLLQTGTGFAVRPSGHSASSHDLRILVQDDDKDPSVTKIEEIGQLEYCGPFVAEDGFTYLNVSFNDEGTYHGDYSIDECNGSDPAGDGS